MAGFDELLALHFALHLWRLSSMPRKVLGIAQKCSVLQSELRQVEPGNPCTLAGSRLVSTKLHQKWGPTGFETHLVSCRKLVRIPWYSSLVRWRRTSYDMDCTELQCVTGRVRQVEPEVHVPCRLSVGAKNRTKNGGRTGFEAHLVSCPKRAEYETSCTLHCALRSPTPSSPQRKYWGLPRTAVCYRVRAASRTGNQCTLPALGWCPKLHQK